MKRMFALVLTLMLLSVACFAQAESAASTYDLCTISGKATVTLTTDYAPLYISQEADQALMNDLGFARVYISTDDLAPCVLSIAKSELADGMSLTEMGQEGIDTLVEMVSEQFELLIRQFFGNPSAWQCEEEKLAEFDHDVWL